MRRLYSPNAPYRNFWEQTHVTPLAEFSSGWGAAAQAIRTREDLDRHLSRRGGLYSALLEKLYTDNESILALGAGDGLHEFASVKKFSGQKKITLSDIAPEFILKIKEFYGVEVLRMDSRNITFPANSFDLVYCLSAEYFFNDDDLSKMLAEMTRVVKKDRLILISSNAVDLDEQGLLQAFYRLGQRIIPPIPWVLLNRFLLCRKVKLVGYSRTVEDFMRLFRRNTSLRLEGIHFDSAEHNHPALAFALRKLA